MRLLLLLVGKFWILCQQLRRCALPQSQVTQIYQPYLHWLFVCSRMAKSRKSKLKSLVAPLCLSTRCCRPECLANIGPYRKSLAAEQQPLNLLQFRRAVIHSYILKYRSHPDLGPPIGRSCPLDERLPTDVRYDGLHHYIDPIPTQHRCAHCGMKAKTVCCKCAVLLHDRCFRQFHCK